ncbi:MAG: hypothetical protein EOP47_19310 [Sphingobacteriaceae bacterium]|nr:MAG: hypothetical protein EOP47_19310 [Sphingobacteriaceae bacterium]
MQKKLYHIMRPKLLLSITIFILFSEMLYAAVPVIQSFSPSSGPVGTLITINGTGLAPSIGMAIGGNSGLIISATDTKVVGMVMPGTTMGTVSVTTGNAGSITVASFTVTPTPYPSQQQGAALVGTGSIGQSRQNSIAISADGNTAIVGGYNDNNEQGAAWIFTRSNSIWSQQGTKITGSAGVSPSWFGTAVAISADGNTAAVTGTKDNGSRGAVWVFTRNNGAWTQQGNKLTNPPSIYQMGEGVALSANGNTLAVTSRGGLTIYVRNNNTWAQLGPILPGWHSDTSSGYAKVVISADGNTIIASHASYGYFTGGTNVYVRNGNTWAQQGGMLFGKQLDDDTEWQGSSLALSADGNIALIGGMHDHAWVFKRNGITWTQYGETLYPVEKSDASEVAMSADGNTITMTGYTGTDINTNVGASWIFTKTSNGYTQQGNVITTSNVPKGFSASALSANGSTLINTSFNLNNQTGGAFVYVPSEIKPAQSIAFNMPLTTFTYGNADVALIATASSGLPVNFTIADNNPYSPAVVSIVNNKLHFTGAGTATVIAKQFGNENFSAAAPVSFIITVNKAPLTITVNDSYTGVGFSLPKFTVKYSGLVIPGDAPRPDYFTYTTTRVTSSPQGVYPVTATGPNLYKYNVVYKPGKLTVLSRDRITGDITKTYGDTDFYLFGVPVEGLTYKTFESSVVKIINGKVHITGAGGAFVYVYYDGSKYFLKRIDVAQAPLTITAENKVGISSKPFPPFTVNYSGFVYGETAADLLALPTITTAANSSSPPGNYPIIAAGAMANTGNYSFIYHNGTLTLGSLQTLYAAIPTKKVTDPDFYVFGAFVSGVNYQSSNAAVGTIVNGKIHINGVGQSTITIQSSMGSISKTLNVIPAGGSLILTQPKINSAVSPNGDGVNDVLTIDNISEYPDNQLTLMNSIGVKVFEATGYDNNNNAFKGYSLSGSRLPAGTYYYQLNYLANGQQYSKKGYFLIKY